MRSARIFLLLLVVDGFAQVPTMKTYVNDSVGFELVYPATYRVADLPCSLARWAAHRGAQSLLYVSIGAEPQAGSIHIALDMHKFSMTTLQAYAHTGWEGPEKIQAGENTFYYSGVGGGGVQYPDDYFYDLNGHILIISFVGPYPPNENTPSGRTKAMERKVLESFQLRQNAGRKQ